MHILYIMQSLMSINQLFLHIERRTLNFVHFVHLLQRTAYPGSGVGGSTVCGKEETYIVAICSRQMSVLCIQVSELWLKKYERKKHYNHTRSPLSYINITIYAAN